MYAFPSPQTFPAIFSRLLLPLCRTFVFLAALRLRCYAPTWSSGSGQDPLLVLVPGLVVAVAALVSEPRASVVGACGLSS